MREIISLSDGWLFTGSSGKSEMLSLPHTWNNIDGQDGGNDYKRCICSYEKSFPVPSLAQDEQLWVEFKGVNSTAEVFLNGHSVIKHEGGYSAFRAELTPYLQPDNTLKVLVDNTKNKSVYPQKADFTFYGGIYRDVNLIRVKKNHFALDFYGSSGILTSTEIKSDGSVEITVETVKSSHEGDVWVSILDAEGNTVSMSGGDKSVHIIKNPHLWDGTKDPYMYTAKAKLLVNEILTDEISCSFGIRSFSVDAENGFMLNGRKYPLHGVSRHQDRRGIGNAISREMHAEDMALIREMGCNSIRLAHYQHDDYFYDLCDKYGMVVWAEIPYISEHMPGGRENTLSQMRELIMQCYNHPSIVCWGISNEITISTKDRRDMLENHRQLNELCHELDKTRFTTLACYAMCLPNDPVAHLTDAVGWNLYLGWYTPGLFLNDIWIETFRKLYPQRPLCFSEYGAEGMPNLHSAKPRRNDHSEEYQCIYHEYMLKTFEKYPWMWANYVWNMFDFAADARNQGGEAGMNHKGLVTFDRQIKKDAFYLYKAYWSEESFVHICGRRFVQRTEEKTRVKVYSNAKSVALYKNGQPVEEKSGEHVFEFTVALEKEPCRIEAIAGGCRDEIKLELVKNENPAYRLEKTKKRTKSNWV